MSDFIENNYNQASYIFEYANKKHWLVGPTLPKNVSFLHSSATSINKTSVIFLRASPAKLYGEFGLNSNLIISDDYSEYAHKLNFIYNFEDHSWKRIIDMPSQLSISATYNLPIAMTIAKDGIRLLKVFGFHSVSIDEYLFENEASIWTLNLDKMVWSVEEINQKEFPTFGIHKICFINKYNTYIFIS